MKEKVDKRLRDPDIRVEFIKRNLDFFKATTFVNEMGINSKNIVDLAALDFKNNILFGFEIKSEVDTLARLYKQLSTYTTFFNIVYVVAHNKHTEAVLSLIESTPFMRNIGLIEVSSDLEFNEVRKATFSTPRFDLFIKNLDTEELESLCESKGQYQGWEPKDMIISKVKRHVTLEEVYEHLSRKVHRIYYKTCPKCGSHLYYNKRDRNGKYHSYCYECGSEIKSTVEYIES